MWEGETQMSELADLKFDGQDQYAADLHVQVETKDGTARAAVILAGAHVVSQECKCATISTEELLRRYR
jgi:hypothetical protein